jgi:hypothetical protein
VRNRVQAFAFKCNLCRYTAGLAKAREMIAEYVPLLGAADTADESFGRNALASSEGSTSLSSSTVKMVSFVFLAGAGTGAVVYYVGPDKIKAMAAESAAKATLWTKQSVKWAEIQTKQTLKWADHQAASLGLKVYLDAVRAHLSALAVHAYSIASHPQVGLH